VSISTVPINTLVIAPQWIGDAVMTEPLLRRLRAQGQTLTVGALPWVAPVYRAMEAVHDVLELPFAHGALQWAQRRALGTSLKGRYARAYICPNSFKSALLPWWADIPWRKGYSGEGRLGLLTERLPNPRRGSRSPMVPHYSALSGDTQVQEDRPALQIPDGSVDAVLQTWGLQRGGYLVFAPGAEYGEAKRWPRRHFATLAQQLDVPAVLLGSAKEAPLCAEICSAANAVRSGACVDVAGKTNLDQALALIAGARAVVSNDSGLMHVAAALAVPQIAIFGSSSPLHTPPLSSRATVLWLKRDTDYRPPLDCAPCFARECPLGHTRCLVDITPASVLRRVRQIAPGDPVKSRSPQSSPGKEFPK
jgi:heptosyltransferase-2